MTRKNRRPQANHAVLMFDEHIYTQWLSPSLADRTIAVAVLGKQYGGAYTTTHPLRTVGLTHGHLYVRPYYTPDSPSPCNKR